MSQPISDREWLLKIAAEVEQDPRRWTQGANALDADGKQNFQRAVCWCANGFALRDFDTLSRRIARALSAASGVEQDTGHRVVEYNDSLTNAVEFVAWFRRAAELCA